MPGIDIDYVYYFGGKGGAPVFYAYNKDIIPPTTYEEHKCFLDKKIVNSNYNEAIQFEPIPSGYFQFAVFVFLLKQLYRYWHARYDEHYIILGKDSSYFHIAKESFGRKLGDSQEYLEKYCNDGLLVSTVKETKFGADVFLHAFNEHVGLVLVTISIITPNKMPNNDEIYSGYEIIIPYTCGYLY